MQNKTVHIVFQVLNFLRDELSKKYKLLPIDKLILITLASHKGIKGIFPMQETIAIELGMTRRHMRNRIKFLEKCGLLFVEKIGRRHYYHLTNLSTEEDLQFPIENTIGEPQFPSQGNYSSSHRGTTVATNNKVNNKINKTERARTKRAAPLSDDFEPNKQTCKAAQNLGLTEEEANFEFDKFMTHYQALGSEKKNWDKALENWFIKAAEYKDRHQNGQTDQIHSLVKDYVPEPAFDREANREVAKKTLGQIFDKLKLNGSGGHHGRLFGQMEKGETGKTK